MAAIDYLHGKGFAARLSGKRIRISPASKLTDADRRYIKNHRLELLAELASNDGRARRMHWMIRLPGKPEFIMIGEPCTHDEAIRHAQTIWPGAEVT